jgi:hypothetical protein
MVNEMISLNGLAGTETDKIVKTNGYVRVSEILDA